MSEEYITLDGLCQQLSISRATGRNWLRLGKIESQGIDTAGQMYFTEEYVSNLKQSLETGERRSLRSRRNKRYVSGKGLYDRYVSDICESTDTVKSLVDKLERQNICVTEMVMRTLLADCALKLLVSSGEITVDREIFPAYIDGSLTIGVWSALIDDIIQDKKAALSWANNNKNLMDTNYYYQKGEDVLGLLYMSIRDAGSRKAAGSYYTPTKVVRTLISDVTGDMGSRISEGGKRLFDPCCGTGNFLIQLPDDIELNNIYACDIDELSVQLARFNLALGRLSGRRHVNVDEAIWTIYEHIERRDFISEYRNDSECGGDDKKLLADPGYDIIIGNPPWGYTFDRETRTLLRKAYRTAAGRGVESSDVFVECALKLLTDEGVIAFVLPEALLDVHNHKTIREIIAESANVSRVSFLGDAFYGVQCPSLVLQLEKSSDPGHSKGAVIERDGREFVVGTDRPLGSENFMLRLTDDEYRLLCRIENTDNCEFLRGQADFALGIVTGDNAKYVSTECGEGMEAVITGADVYRYRCGKTEKYMYPELTLYQQAAPLELYRAPEKLIYRFINRQLVFAYDDRQRLTLNSCNVVIPHIPGLDMRYIMAILNSRVAQYIYEKRYNAVKVLRSHIENIPVPVADEETQRRIISKAEELMAEELITESSVNSEMQTYKTGKDHLQRYRLYEEIDDIVRKLYSVTDEEYEFIKQSLSGDKYML